MTELHRRVARRSGVVPRARAWLSARLRAATALAQEARRRPPHLWAAVACLALGCATLVSFAQLAEDYVTRDRLVAWDERFAGWLHHEATATGVDVFEVVTVVGGTAFLAALTGLAALLLVRRDRLAAGYVVAVFAGVEALNLALKLAFARERPQLDHPFVHLDTYSFPSGHASGSIAVYGALAILLARRSDGWPARAAVVIAALTVVAVVGFSRLYLGAHFLSDVLAGFDAGFTWLMAATAGWLYAEGRRRSSQNRDVG
jgi:membrane-associated phospholipid phosphatase